MKISSTKPHGATTFKDSAFGVLSHKKLLPLELQGTKKGLEFIADVFSKEKIVTVTPDLILRLHLVSFGWIFPDWAGKFRTIQVRFSDIEAPQYHLVPGFVSNLCLDLEERLIHHPDPVELLSWFQHRFVYIHPFQDYNGRTARMLSYLIMLNLSIEPREIRAENKADRRRYLEAMQAADNGDYTKLQKLIRQSLKK